MHIKLVCPSFYDMSNKLFSTKSGTLPPLILYYLAAFVPPNHKVSVVNEMVEKIAFDEAVDLIGITSTTGNARRAYEISTEYRKRGVKVVMGGIHATFLSDEALKYVDAVVIGEGEASWREVISDAEQGILKKKYFSPPPNSLEKLPLPRFDLLNQSHYFKFPGGTGPIIPIQTARGCPHSCSFCSVTKFWGKKIRVRPIEEIVKEIQACGSNMIFFTDDNFFANTSRAIQLCDAIKPLKIKFLCQIDAISKGREEAIQALSRSGCFLTFIGFERIDDDGLNTINKQFNTPDQYKYLISLLHRKGIGVYASLIQGLKGDSKNTVKKMVQFLIDSKVEIAAFWPISPYPGTTFYEEALKSKVLVDDRWWLHEVDPLNESLIRFPENTLTEYDLVREAMKQFYSIPSIIKRSFWAGKNKILFGALNFQVRRRMLRHGDMCTL